MKNIKELTTWILTIALLGYLFISNVNNGNSENYRYEYETVENDPLNTLIYTLDNGLKVYMSVNTDEPRIQTNIAVNIFTAIFVWILGSSVLTDIYTFNPLSKV